MNTPINNCVYAHTSSGIDYPSYINVSRTDAGDYRVTVRSAGNDGRDVASINLAPEGLEQLAANAMNTLHGDPVTQRQVTDEMVARFLGWRLPPDFYPDCYVSFDREKSIVLGSWPIGTNILNAIQARTMLEHVLQPHPVHQSHQQRVVAERADLDDKRGKLNSFMNGEKFHIVCNEDERIRMIDQYNAMTAYSRVLGERIDAFATPAEAKAI